MAAPAHSISTSQVAMVLNAARWIRAALHARFNILKYTVECRWGERYEWDWLGEQQ